MVSLIRHWELVQNENGQLNKLKVKFHDRKCEICGFRCACPFVTWVSFGMVFHPIMALPCSSEMIIFIPDAYAL